ncbi:MAG TPA: alpha/beta fold hydrolase [Solirubrobacteraceae bacterium]|jgi:pimeloyl-ACP methyl ester carboxylesterase|nr:alpha/beta fold hydrolase [Solirubrobacteraceae bacterium]
MRALAATIASAVACACWAPASASAEIAYKSCADTSDFACGHLVVPLDRSGALHGTINLAIRRHRAPLGEARTAVIALAGGPGQAALPFAEAFVELLSSVASTRDVIAFDQRGTGLSGALSCHAVDHPATYRSIGAMVSACATELGAARSHYTSAESVEDIEAIRQAGGYEKLVLYGTSYGTKVAELYAQEHPEHVEALVLDSVVTPTGPDPFVRSTFAAVGPVLRSLCRGRACAHITRDPVADLARVLARARRARGGLRGRALDARGHAHRIPINGEGLISALLEGDFSPPLRAEFVTAVRAAATGDTAPLARLLGVAREAEAGEQEGFDNALYFATTCEEQAFPWQRTSSPHARLAEAIAAARALPASAFAPFDAATAIGLGDIPSCASWPYTAPLPAASTAPLPAVPTLILSGADDLRTPTADARALAAQIPGSHLLVVPYTGHAVLGDEPTNCGREAVVAVFAGRAPHACAGSAPSGERPPPLPPLHVRAVAPGRGLSGRAGRTLRATALTLADLDRQLALQIGASGGLSGIGLGGLRSGFARFSGVQLRLTDYSFIPGLRIDGTLTAGAANLHIGGREAAAGTLHLAGRSLAGTLEGRHVTLPANTLGAAAIVRGNEQASPPTGAGLPARRRVARLDGLVADILAPLLRSLR